MNLEQYFKGYGRIISKTGYAFFLTIFLFQAAFGQVSFNTFTKKEIAFFKWGNGKNEIGMNDQDNANQTVEIKKTNKKTGEVVTEETTPTIGSHIPRSVLHIDGTGNLYFSDSVHKQIFVLSPDGEVVRTISSGNDPNFQVDEAGNVFFYDHKVNEPQGLTCIKSTGEKFFYKDFQLTRLENGTAYGSYTNKPVITIVKGNKSVNYLPGAITITSDFKKNERKLLSGSVEKNGNSYVVYVELEPGPGNSKTEQRKIPVQIEEKPKLEYSGRVLGVDNLDNVYIVSEYRKGVASCYSVVESNVDIYSKHGEHLAQIVNPYVIGAYDVDLSNFCFDTKGFFYFMWQSIDGVHIFKWSQS